MGVVEKVIYNHKLHQARAMNINTLRSWRIFLADFAFYKYEFLKHPLTFK
jgi:hypothetical protein